MNCGSKIWKKGVVWYLHQSWHPRMNIWQCLVKRYLNKNDKLDQNDSLCVILINIVRYNRVLKLMNCNNVEHVNTLTFHSRRLKIYVNLLITQPYNLLQERGFQHLEKRFRQKNWVMLWFFFTPLGPTWERFWM